MQAAQLVDRCDSRRVFVGHRLRLLHCWWLARSAAAPEFVRQDVDDSSAKSGDHSDQMLELTEGTQGE